MNLLNMTCAAIALAWAGAAVSEGALIAHRQRHP